MDNEVVIKISGLQKLNETGDDVEFLAAGKYYKKNNKHYLLYEDMDEEFDKLTKNTIKFDNDWVEVTRKGVVSSKLVFRKGENNQSIYYTPFGDMLMEVYTKDIELKEKEKNINLKIDYTLAVNSAKLSDNRICINVSETMVGIDE